MPRLGLGSSLTGGAVSSDDTTSFVSTCRTTGSDETVTLPFISSGTIDFTINWGDGGSDAVTAYNDNLGQGAIDHVYETADDYTITLSGTIRGFKFANGGDKAKIRTITQWGTFQITTTSVFQGCSNLVVSAEDAPTIDTTSMINTFQSCTSLTSLGDGETLWDVSSVENMNTMFQGTIFNGNITGWDVSSVTNMNYMFGFNAQFNQDIGSWDVSSVTVMSLMFYQATSFNGNIGNWGTKTGAVTTMASMFYNCDSFNQDISSWCTVQVSNMSSMFQLAHTFNQDISDWNTVKVTNMSYMLNSCSAFNQDINTSETVKWNT